MINPHDVYLKELSLHPRPENGEYEENFVYRGCRHYIRWGYITYCGYFDVPDIFDYTEVSDYINDHIHGGITGSLGKRSIGYDFGHWGDYVEGPLIEEMKKIGATFPNLSSDETYPNPNNRHFWTFDEVKSENEKYIYLMLIKFSWPRRRDFAIFLAESGFSHPVFFNLGRKIMTYL